MVRPFDDVILDDDDRIRVFTQFVDDEELVWHRDKRNRQVTVVSGKDWLFQYEDELPFKLKEGMTLNIEAMKYHRVVKGSDSLVLRIIEE